MDEPRRSYEQGQYDGKKVHNCTKIPFSPAPDDLKHNSRQILLLFVSADDLKQENGQILLKIVRWRS